MTNDFCFFTMPFLEPEVHQESPDTAQPTPLP